MDEKRRGIGIPRRMTTHRDSASGLAPAGENPETVGLPGLTAISPRFG